MVKLVMTRCILVAFTFLLCACPKPAVQKLIENDLLKTLTDAKPPWTPLVIPDSTYKPGSIIAIHNGTPDWLGQLTTEACNIPENILKPIPGNSALFDTTKSYKANIAIAATIKGIGLEAGADSGNTAHIRIEDQGFESLDLVSLRAWLKKNKKVVNQDCVNWFETEGYYLVRRAFAIRKGVITFKENVGGKIAVLDKLKLGKILKIGGSAGASLNEDGTMTINKPVYIAIRNLKGLVSGIKVLGGNSEAQTPQEKNAENALRAYSEKILGVQNTP